MITRAVFANTSNNLEIVEIRLNQSVISENFIFDKSQPQTQRMFVISNPTKNSNDATENIYQT